MTVAVIAHVEADRPYVESLHSKLEGVRLIACAVKPKTPVMAFEARLPLILIWSEDAAAQGADRTFAALARAHLGQTILCVIDHASLPPNLARLQASVVEGSPRSSLFPGGLIAALAEARRRQFYVQAARPEPMQHVRRAFTEGMTRGLAGSVAVFGVGGAAALSVDQPSDFGPAPDMMADAQVEELPLEAPVEMAALDETEWTAPTVIVVETDKADVPLANPAPDEVAASQAAAFVTDTPLEVWAPEPVEPPAFEFATIPELEIEALALGEAPIAEPPPKNVEFAAQQPADLRPPAPAQVNEPFTGRPVGDGWGAPIAVNPPANAGGASAPGF